MTHTAAHQPVPEPRKRLSGQKSKPVSQPSSEEYEQGLYRPWYETFFHMKTLQPMLFSLAVLASRCPVRYSTPKSQNTSILTGRKREVRWGVVVERRAAVSIYRMAGRSVALLERCGGVSAAGSSTLVSTQSCEARRATDGRTRRRVATIGRRTVPVPSRPGPVPRRINTRCACEPAAWAVFVASIQPPMRTWSTPGFG